MTLLMNPEKAMSSLEIAELANKQHQHVKRDISKMLEELNLDTSTFGHIYFDTQNRKQTKYLLNKRECLILASGYSVELRAKIIDRWIELESNKPKLPSKKELAQMVIESENKIEKLSEENQIKDQVILDQAPKVKYFEEVLESKSSYTANQVAKELGMSARKLNKELNDLKVQYKQSGTWLLYSRYQNQGYTETRTYTYYDSQGKKKTSMATLWTERGRKFIHTLLNTIEKAS